MNLAGACWPDLAVGAELVLFPLGSCEQHGPHLPFSTDTLIADAMARGSRLVIAPGSARSDDAEPGATEPVAELLPKLRREGVVGVCPNGVLGDPSGASAGEGMRLLDALIADVVAAAQTGSVDENGRLVRLDRRSA